MVESTPTLPNLADRSSWPSPVDDTAMYSFVLFDLLEYQRTSDLDALRWDMLGWLGGDYNRFWFKSEGRKVFTSRESSEVEAQALYGRLIAPFFDVQVGLRYDQRLQRGANRTRVYAVIGLQGLAPYWFDIEPTLFISNKGKVSARLTATYDVLLSQRLVLQPRLEINAAFQKDEAIGIAAGLNDVELGGRLRYEIRRVRAVYRRDVEGEYRCDTQAHDARGRRSVPPGLRGRRAALVLTKKSLISIYNKPGVVGTGAACDETCACGKFGQSIAMKRSWRRWPWWSGTCTPRS